MASTIWPLATPPESLIELRNTGGLFGPAVTKITVCNYITPAIVALSNGSRHSIQSPHLYLTSCRGKSTRQFERSNTIGPRLWQPSDSMEATLGTRQLAAGRSLTPLCIRVVRRHAPGPAYLIQQPMVSPLWSPRLNKPSPVWGDPQRSWVYSLNRYRNVLDTFWMTRPGSPWTLSEKKRVYRSLASRRHLPPPEARPRRLRAIKATSNLISELGGPVDNRLHSSPGSIFCPQTPHHGLNMGWRRTQRSSALQPNGHSTNGTSLLSDRLRKIC